VQYPDAAAATHIGPGSGATANHQKLLTHASEQTAAPLADVAELSAAQGAHCTRVARNEAGPGAAAQEDI